MPYAALRHGELLVEWAEALSLAGYTMHQAQEETLGQMIEFSGRGIINAKIAVAPINDQANTNSTFTVATCERFGNT